MIIRFALSAMDVHNPTYIDIGAYHPYYLSNTAHFYQAGCRGINIEPNPLLFRAFGKHRPHDINLTIEEKRVQHILNWIETGEMPTYV